MPELLGQQSKRRIAGGPALSLAVTALLALIVVAPFISLGFGAAAVPFSEAIQIFAGKISGSDMAAWKPSTVAIIWQNRLPRIITAYGVGIILGVAGVAMQAVIRNPLAEPYVLGISSGASTGAAVALVMFGTSMTLVVTSSAFVGAFLATVFVLWLGSSQYGGSLRLVLAGIAIGFIFQALTNLVIVSANTAETAQSVVFWTLGSLTRASLEQSLMVMGVAIALTVLLLVAAPYLDALSSGDQTCIAVGLNPRLLRFAILVPVSLAVAFAVATSGGIGFIGLVVPHLMRPLVGHRHRPLVLFTALFAAVFLLSTDTVARTILAPVEIPIGVITALLGAPFLIVMTRRLKSLR